MKRSLFAAAFLAAVIVITACQPTPEAPAVVNKGNDSVMEKILESPAGEATAYKWPEEWKESIETGKQNIKIEVDSEIITTDVDKYPVVEVKPLQFTQQEVDKMAGYFAGESKLFKWPSPETKADLEDELIRYKRGNEVDGKFVPPSADDPYIKELEKRIRNAPDDNERIYIDTTMDVKPDGGKELSAGIELTDDEDANIYVKSCGSDDCDSSLIYHRGGTMLNGDELKRNSMELGPITISEEEAVNKSNKALSDLGINHMKLSSVVKERLLALGNLAGMRSNYESSGYMLIYTRENAGLQCVNISNGGIFEYSDRTTKEYLPEYNAPWYQELIITYVDGNGLQRFGWTGCAELGETVTSNAQLLGFEQIQDRARKQLYYQNGGNALSNVIVTINVNRIELGLAVINKRNEPRTGLLVPAWYFFFEIYEEVENAAKPEDYPPGTGVLVLNAIDGSVINPMPVKS